MSAPASTQAQARSIAASRPSTASASVRAMMTKSGSVRASTAALMRSTISSCDTSSLFGPVAAALGADLVLDVHRRRAELDQRPDRARDVERRRAEAGVDVDQQRQRAGVGDAAHVGQHVVEIADAEVGHAERAGGDAAAGQVERLEAAIARRGSRDRRRSRRAPAAAVSAASAARKPRAGRMRGHARVSRGQRQPSSDATPARSSSSSFSVASIFSRENASIVEAA